MKNLIVVTSIVAAFCVLYVRFTSPELTDTQLFLRVWWMFVVPLGLFAIDTLIELRRKR